MSLENNKLVFAEDQNGAGRGAWFLGRFLFWGSRLKRSVIFLERSQIKAEHLLLVIYWLLMLSGYLALGFWFFLNYENLFFNPERLLLFWQEDHPLILFFLFSLWFDLFLVYKYSQKRAALKRIKYHLFKTSKIKSGANKRYNISSSFSDAANQVLADSYLLAKKLRRPNVEIIHVFRSILQNKEAQNVFIRLNVDAEKMVAILDRVVSRGTEIAAKTVLSLALQELLVEAFVEAHEFKQDSVDCLNILSFCYDRDPLLADVLRELEIDGDKIKNTIAWFRVNRQLLNNYRNFRRLAILKPGSNMNRSYTAIATPTLDRYSDDLTVSAKNGRLDICVGREKEIASIFDNFTGGHYGVLLVGPAGVGKNTIVSGLAQLMVAENVPGFLRDKRLVEIDVARLVAGAAPGEAEARLLTCLSEVSYSGNIIVYINNLETIIGITAGSEGSLDLSEVLAGALRRRNIYCLASATVENYSKYIEASGLGAVITTIGIHEPEINEGIQMLESKVGFLESKYNIYMVYGAIEQAVKMSVRYIHDKYLPLKAINLLEQAAIIASRRSLNNPTDSFCGAEEVATAISEATGIPVKKITSSESNKLLNLEAEIHRRLIGQEEAVKAVCASLRRARAQLKDSKRPIASFLFLGPTGVGKTELAKAVSESYFGDEKYIVRLDMSEYQAMDSIRKMIGDVDGTLGYLTEAVRKKPFSLILLDEIEKANPDILNLFLQLLDEGRLTDGQGRTISFSESIIIATSNIGATYIQDQIKVGTGIQLIKQELIDNQLHKYMRPELVNRFDGIIVFKPLTEENVFSIATLLLKKIKKNLAEQGINLKADRDGVVALAHQGYDPKFGARPLRRLLQDKIEGEVANNIISGQLRRRDTVVINSQSTVEIIRAPEL